jgi:exodeoxyribonuclease V alpha subunit
LTKATVDKDKLVKLDGEIVACIYQNGDYAIYEIMVLNMDELLQEDDKTVIPEYEFTTITGNFEKRMFNGEQYIFYALPKVHKKYGKQYVVQFVKNKFDTKERVRAFMLQFVAESIADQLIAKYGSELIQRIIDNDVDYSDIKGMGDYRFNAMREKVLQNEYMKDIIMELGEFGITPNQMKKVVMTFGANAVKVIKENPYKLCLVHGIGFKKADEIAKQMGYDMESPNRIKEAIKYCLEENENNGNSWMDRKELLYAVADLIGVSKKLIDQCLTEELDGVLILGNRVARAKTYEMEVEIAERVLEMVRDEQPLNFDMDAFIQEIESGGIKLTDEQKQFFYNFAKYRINLLIGYAGCGKSFLQKYVLEIARRLGMSPLLMAPTGKAAKIMEQYTGRKAYTLHRALKYGMGSEPQQVYNDLVIFDEGSMGDIPMYRVLLWALANPKARLLIVGDDFQLPSVGVGNVLSDMIRSGVIPTTKLTKVFRQEEGGLLDIVTKIREGKKFLPDDFVGKKKFGKDLIIHCVPQDKMEDAYKYYYKKALNIFNVDDITVVTPTKKSHLGTIAINSVIQNIVNEHGANEIKYGKDVVYREGDCIINTQNTYGVIDIEGKEHDIMNGDQGVIERIDTQNQRILIDYGFAKVWISYAQLENITHSYALTMHKSQGSGFPCVISVLDKSHKFQLNANLLYTAWTRAKKYCISVTQADVINYAIKRNANMERNTFLCELLKDGIDKNKNK